MASDVELALNEVFINGTSTTGGCVTNTATKVEKAVANAVACGFVKVFAAARDACTPGVTYACSATLSIAGPAASLAKCNLQDVCGGCAGCAGCACGCML